MEFNCLAMLAKFYCTITKPDFPYIQHIQGVLNIGASYDTADTILPYLLNRVTRIYPKLSLDICVKRAANKEMLNNSEVDLAISVQSDRYAFAYPVVMRCTSPTLWCCAADYRFTPGEVVLLVVPDGPCNFAPWMWNSLMRRGYRSVLATIPTIPTIPTMLRRAPLLCKRWSKPVCASPYDRGIDAP